MPTDAATQAQLQSERQDISAKLAKLDFEADRRLSEIDIAKQTIDKPARLFHRGSACRAQEPDAWLRDATSRGYMASERSGVQSGARACDAASSEAFCRV
jgi:hypothetical protein